MTAKRLLTLAVLAASLAAFAAVADPASARTHRARAHLSAFSSCSSLIAYGNRYAPRQAVPVWHSAPPTKGAPTSGSTGESGGGDSSTGTVAPQQQSSGAPAAAPAPTTAAGDFSGTNNQESNVDEPDMVKTDGSTVFAVTNGKLFAVDVRGGGAKLAGTLDLPPAAYGAQLLISGGHAILMWTDGGFYYSGVGIAGGGPAPAAGGPASPGGTRARASMVAYPYGGEREQTILAEVDISDPAAMKIVRSLAIDGRLVSSRLNGTTARVITAASPRALEVVVDANSDVAAQRTALGKAGSARAAKWLPRRVARRGLKGKARARAAVACTDVRRPPVFSGLDMVTILTIDLSKGLTPVDSDALMTDADTVYASEKSLYIATRKWLPQVDSPLPYEGTIPEPPPIRTQIHRFDISDSQNTVYRSSGDVSGYLLNQFSLSEDKGILRVASTDGPSWWPGPAGTTTSSSVTTLDDRAGGLLATVGRVGGLGQGERIYAVRFIGDTGYVVTFRQTDPLFVIDASDPAKPKVVGELKLRGYSAYLHPVGDNLLIGVGQDATPDGQRLGAQVSLFDVSDPANPKRVASKSLGQYSSTDAEYDHHAFLYWPATNLLVLPFQQYDEKNSFAGAIGFRVKAATGIDEIARISHDNSQYPVPIQRSMVIGDRVYTLSSLGLKASDLTTLADAGFVAFPTGG